MPGARVARRPGLSVRWKLTLSYAGFLLLAMLLLLAVVWLFLLRYVPAQAAVTMDGFTPGRDDLVRAFTPAAAWALLFLLGFGLLGGWFLAGRMLAPLTRITNATRKTAEGSLSHRIELEGRSDEFRELADSFDAMLARLEAHIAEQQRFAANASHELQTPLATTRTMLDVALGAHPDGAERALLERLRLVNERSIAAVEALLDLSQLERGGPIETAPVRLDRLVSEVLAELVPEAEAAGIRVRSELAPATAVASAPLLRQLALNLAQNAIRHNEPGGEVVVETGPVDASPARLRVANTGPVVPPEAVAALTEPFFRAPGRVATGGVQGRGLGLSIVAAIAERHDAELGLVARDGGGLEVELRFPRP